MKNKYSINLVTTDIPDIRLESNYSNIYDSKNRNQIVDYFNYFTSWNITINNCSINDVSNNKDTEYYFALSTQNVFYKDLCTLFEDGYKSKILLNLFLNKNLKIFFINLHESEDVEYITKFLNILKSNDIDLNQIFLINNDSKIYQHAEEYNWGVNVYRHHHIYSFTQENLLKEYSTFNPVKNNNFFLNLNHTPHPHRLILLSLLHYNNLLSDMNYSLLSKKMYSDFDLKTLIGNNLFEKIAPSIELLESMTPIISKNEKTRNELFSLNLAFDSPSEIYLNSYINIVSETLFFSKNVHITEKSIRPFYFYQIPLIFASHNHIKFLKDTYGFDMFDDIVDHSYDDEEDDIKRMFKFLTEIERLDSNKNDIINNYKLLQSRLESNKKIIYDLKLKLLDLDKFDDIYNKKI